MILTPLDQNDPRLRQVCAEVSKGQLREREQQQEIDALIDYVYGVVDKTTVGRGVTERAQPRTVGLSANQVGIMKQICIVDMAIGRKGYHDLRVLVNPRIIVRSKAEIMKPEGCVNFVTTWGVTRRSRTIEVLCLDRSGNELLMKLTGWPAILLQHEVDHLQGRLFIDRLPDPRYAHHVELEEYPLYRKMKPEQWEKFVDVSEQVVR
jgi:peptide deformylase